MLSHLSWARRCVVLSWCLALAACTPTVQTPDGQQPAPDQGRIQPGAPRPLDPLTDAERQQASRLALADPRIVRIAGDRAHDVAFVELLVRKPTDPVDDADRPPNLGRRAEVLVSVFERRFTGIRAVVDLERQVVEEVSELPSEPAALDDSLAVGTAVPFSPREVELSRRLVFASPEFRTLIDRPADEITVEYLPITTVDRELCPSGRCLELLFRRGDSYSTTTAIVDIPTQRVRFRRGER